MTLTFTVFCFKGLTYFYLLTLSGTMAQGNSIVARSGSTTHADGNGGDVAATAGSGKAAVSIQATPLRPEAQSPIDFDFPPKKKREQILVLPICSL
jgi:hypothetical protein